MGHNKHIFNLLGLEKTEIHKLFSQQQQQQLFLVFLPMQAKEEAFCLNTEYLYIYELTSIHIHSRVYVPQLGLYSKIFRMYTAVCNTTKKTKVLQQKAFLIWTQKRHGNILHYYDHTKKNIICSLGDSIMNMLMSFWNKAILFLLIHFTTLTSGSMMQSL